MCWASVSARNGASLSTTSPIASLTTSSKRDMCAPFCWWERSTKQSSCAKYRSSPIRTTFSTPVTPTRERPTRMPGVRAWTSSPVPIVGDIAGVGELARTRAKPSAAAIATGPGSRAEFSTADSGITPHLVDREGLGKVIGLRSGRGGRLDGTADEHATDRRLSVGQGRARRGAAPPGGRGGDSGAQKHGTRRRRRGRGGAGAGARQGPRGGRLHGGRSGGGARRRGAGGVRGRGTGAAGRPRGARPARSGPDGGAEPRLAAAVPALDRPGA